MTDENYFSADENDVSADDVVNVTKIRTNENRQNKDVREIKEKTLSEHDTIDYVQENRYPHPSHDNKKHHTEMHIVGNNQITQDVDNNTVPDYVDEFIQKMMETMKLKRKATRKQDLNCIIKGLSKIPIESGFNIDHLEWLLRVEQQTDKTPFQIVLEEEELVVQKIQKMQKNGVSFEDASLQTLYQELDHWSELKEDVLCKQDKQEHEMKQQIQEFVSVLPQMQKTYHRFARLLKTIQLQKVFTVESGFSRWEALLSNSSHKSSSFSYKFCSRVLYAPYRLFYILQSKITLDGLVQEPSFKWGELCREELEAILVNTLHNTFLNEGLNTLKDSLNIATFNEWLERLPVSNKKKVWVFIGSVLKKKYESNVFKENYGYIRSAFHQKQALQSLPHFRCMLKKEKLAKEIQALQQQLEQTTDSKGRYRLRHVKLKAVEKRWNDINMEINQYRTFPYDEAQFNRHVAWLKEHIEFKSILDVFD